MAKDNKNNNANHQNSEHQNQANNIPNNNNKKQDEKESNKELNSLKDKVTKLEEELKIKDLKIADLEKQINQFNTNYKNELIKKSNEAQTKLQEKIKEYQTKYETELANAKKYALKDKAVELINIINNFDVAVNLPVSNPEIQNYVKGFMMFSNMFKNYLESNHIDEIKVNVNDEYDPKTMEAFDTEKSDTIKPNHVVKVVKKGYKLYDIVIVPAIVVVSK